MTNNKSKPNTAAASVRGLVTTAVASWERAQQTDHDALKACAAATFAAFDAGLIGKDQSANGGWDSAGDYAARFVSSRTGKAVSPTTIILWRRYGRAASLGVSDETLTRVVQCFGDKRVSGVLESGTRAQIERAVKAIHNRDGSRKQAPKENTAGENKGDKGADAPEGVTAALVTRNNSTTITALEELLARVSSPSKRERERLAEFAQRVLMVAGVVETPALEEVAQAS